MDNKSLLSKKDILRFFSDAGIKESDSTAKKRSIRISNLIAFTVIFNSLAFATSFYFLNDWILFKAALVGALIYCLAYIPTFFGYTLLGRALLNLTGNCVVFWFACYFHGESLIQLFLYSLSVTPFMQFAWEERRFYGLTVISIALLILGQFFSFHLFEGYTQNYNLTAVRVIAVVTPLFQIISGFYYFLKQSVHFEKESIEALERLEAEHRKQVQVQKMSSLGEMAGGIAHEINNPLAIILGKTNLIKKTLIQKSSENDTTFIALQKIEETVNRIAKIIRALRIFSRNAEQDPSEVAGIRQIIDDTLEICRQRFVQARIELKVNVSPEVKVFCRPTEISQVLLNLLNNSYDAVQGTPNAWINLNGKNLDKDTVEILVEDSGSGIPPEVAEKIMQPFFTTKEIGAGTGLGLSISKGIVESHNGRLTLVQNTGHTTFQILLPKA